MSRRWVARGSVQAPPHAVFTALLDVGPVAGARTVDGTVTDSGGVRRYRASIGEPASTLSVEVDAEHRTLAVQGNWWYRGVYTVHSGADGSQVEYRVHNVADRLAWAVPLMQRRLPRQLRRDLAALLERIGRHLNCPAHLLPDDDRGR